MRSYMFTLLASGMLAGPLVLSLKAPDVAPTAPVRPTRYLEAARLRAHFDSVDTELRAAGTARLTLGQRTARATLADWLREYRDAGEFPRNDRFPHHAMPFFRDSDGTLCAMAYLIDRSGRGDLVDRIAATRNNAFIAELADDRDLRAWLDSTGLLVGEAGRIQPWYEYFPEPDDEVSTGYALTSILVSGASVTTLGFNLIAPSRSSGWAGLIAGGAGVIAGAANVDGTGELGTVAAANLIVGGGAVAAGLYRLLNPGAARPMAQVSPVSEKPGLRLAVGPGVIPTSGGARLGLAIRGDF